jgi:hypothetical protein
VSDRAPSDKGTQAVDGADGPSTAPGGGSGAAEGPGLAFSQRVLAFEAATGVPHEAALLLAAPFALVVAVRWFSFRIRQQLAGASRS